MEIPEVEEIFETADGLEMLGLFYGSSFDASPGNREVITTKSCLHTESPFSADLKEGTRIKREKTGETYEISSSRDTGLGFYEVELRSPEEGKSGSLGRF